jgi:hypothetical protein
MKISNKTTALILPVILLILLACDRPTSITDPGDLVIPPDYGTLEVDFELPPYPGVQDGIRRADLAVSSSMDDLYREVFIFRANVSDVKEFYQIYLPEGTFYYRAAITCTCLADSCITAGFPEGYGGMKFAFDEVTVEKGKIIRSKPSFQ